MRKTTLWIIAGASTTAFAAWAATTMPTTNPSQATVLAPGAGSAPMAISSPATMPSANAATSEPSDEDLAHMTQDERAKYNLAKIMRGLGQTTRPTTQAINNNYNNNSNNNNGNNANGRNGRRTRRNGGGNGTFAGGGPTSGPSDLAEIAPTAAMPIVYDDISRRNIFVHGNQAGYTGEGDNNNNGNNTPAPPPPLVLDAITEDPGSYTADVEDTGTNLVSLYKVGDTLPRNYGKISAITIDSMDIESNGQKKTIGLRQDLNGQDAWSSLYQNQVMSTPIVEVAPPSLPAGSGSSDDIEVRMKMRRVQELQGILGGNPPIGGPGGGSAGGPPPGGSAMLGGPPSTRPQ